MGSISTIFNGARVKIAGRALHDTAVPVIRNIVGHVV